MKRLLALLPLAVGVLADTKGPGIVLQGGEPVQFRVYCETSGASPLLHHIWEAADHVNPDGECYQSNKVGSHCTKIEKSEGAIISICGPDRKRYDIPCGDVETMARAVADHCGSPLEGGDRAGGYVYREYRTFTSWSPDPPAWVEVTRNK